MAWFLPRLDVQSTNRLTFNGKEIVYSAPLKSKLQNQLTLNARKMLRSIEIQVAAANFKWINCTKQFKGYWIGTAANKLKYLSTTHKTFFEKKYNKVSEPVAVQKSPSFVNRQHYIEIKIFHWNEFKKILQK